MIIIVNWHTQAVISIHFTIYIPSAKQPADHYPLFSVNSQTKTWTYLKGQRRGGQGASAEEECQRNCRL